MKKSGIMKYKMQLALMTLVFFCLNLIPFSNVWVNADTKELQKIKEVNTYLKIEVKKLSLLPYSYEYMGWGVFML